MIAAKYYYAIFLYTVIFLTIIYANKIAGKDYRGIKNGTSNFTIAIIVCLIFALFLGGRPYASGHFGDSTNYAITYYRYSHGIIIYSGNESEWLWAKIMSMASKSMDISTFFTIIDLLYFGFTLWACKKLCSNNIMIALLFMIGAFSFYTYGTNGIRNGLACSIVLVAISYMTTKKRNLLIAILLSICAAAIHRTSLLPIITLFISVYLIKSFKWAYTFWILSIVVSLVAGGFMENLFAALGFDDRFSLYTQSNAFYEEPEKRFRWDFLIYSMMPIILGYYVVIRRGIRDKSYETLLATYTLANAFWVMVIRASFSNRFAYLSWFMFPLVLVYPLLKLDIWGPDQGKRTSQIMLAHVGFTWFMATIYS